MFEYRATASRATADYHQLKSLGFHQALPNQSLRFRRLLRVPETSAEMAGKITITRPADRSAIYMCNRTRGMMSLKIYYLEGDASGGVGGRTTVSSRLQFPRDTWVRAPRRRMGQHRSQFKLLRIGMWMIGASCGSSRAHTQRGLGLARDSCCRASRRASSIRSPPAMLPAPPGRCVNSRGRCEGEPTPSE